MSKPLHIAFYVTTLGSGGIGKWALNLSQTLVRSGIRVDLLLAKADGPYLRQIDPGVRVIRLNTSHALFSLPGLIRYLRSARPDCVITEKLRANTAILRARRLARVSSLVIATVHGVLSHKLDQEGLSPQKQKTGHRVLRHSYPRNDAVICVSDYIRRDLIQSCPIAPEKVHVVYNPVITPQMYDQSRLSVEHPFWSPKQCPVLLSVGRLVPQKDYDTLLRAVAQCRQTREMRLIILGDGPLKQHLAARISALGLERAVDLHGFVNNPYAYMAQADLFVLSSAWEGFGIVLAEALALGLPVVATDCPGGPREILADGRHGSLVPVGDVRSLARSILATLDAPPDPESLPKAAQRFTAGACARGYLKILNPHG